jgi:hypothetical protein
VIFEKLKIKKLKNRKVPKKRPEISKEQLAKDFRRVEKIAGRRPRAVDIKEHGTYGFGWYVSHYGSWANFLQSQGFSEAVIYEHASKFRRKKENRRERGSGSKRYFNFFVGLFSRFTIDR